MILKAMGIPGGLGFVFVLFFLFGCAGSLLLYKVFCSFSESVVAVLQLLIAVTSLVGEYTF